MKNNDVFVPHHINATPSDLEGNNGIGRYVILPGSDGRAQEIAKQFENMRVLPHPRCHNLYLGEIQVGDRKVDVATISTGMGCPSIDIIVNELCNLGAKRLLRVGTAGSLQPAKIRVGNLVVATSSVRDENCSRLYVPVEVPAVSSFEFQIAAMKAVEKLGFQSKAYFGTVHCKDSLFAREFGAGPMAEKNAEYMKVLRNAGILASEMESSQLFTLSALFDHQMSKYSQDNGRRNRVFCGAILGIVGDDQPFAASEDVQSAIDDSVRLVLETVRQMAEDDTVQLNSQLELSEV